MKKSMVATLIMFGVAAAACGKISIQVKKQSKNGSLQSSTATPEAASTDNFGLANPEDFLRHLDDLRTNAANLIIKQLASQDYVGKFRSGVRTYRKFLQEKSKSDVALADAFYSDPKQECRETKFSLNVDKNNEMLGLILQTVLLAKISEANVGKLNAGLAKEMQALSQFITLELGLDVKGTSTVDKIDGYDVSRGQVAIKLLPIANEAIDEATKAADAASVMTLNFERKLASDQIGTFHADLRLDSEDPVPAVATFDIARSKEADHYNHVASVVMGSLGKDPVYSRQIVVADIPKEKLKFKFTDILNAGKASEISAATIVDVEKGTQCKDHSSNPTEGKDEGNKPSTNPEPAPTPTAEPTPPQTTPSQMPSQTPVQSSGKK